MSSDTDTSVADTVAGMIASNTTNDDAPISVTDAVTTVGDAVTADDTTSTVVSPEPDRFHTNHRFSPYVTDRVKRKKLPRGCRSPKAFHILPSVM